MKIVLFLPFFLSYSLFCSETTFTIYKFNKKDKTFDQVVSSLPLTKRTVIEQKFKEGKDTTLWVEGHNVLLIGTGSKEDYLKTIKRVPKRRMSIAKKTAAARAAFLKTSS